MFYLERAARFQDTFYGMLAAEALGQDITLDFSLPNIDQNYINWLNGIPGGRRAFALLQVGETYHASREFRYLWDEHSVQDQPKLMALAAETHMAGLAFRTAGIINEDTGRNWYAGLYPIPDFTTDMPIRVDQSLLLAIMRQESGFNPRAKSWAKASGLMQLMPATAAYIARDGGYRNAKRHDLLIPEVNIRLGEDYILYLLKAPIVDSDLIRLLAAYNAGPGNLSKWSKKIDHGGDQLILLESLPARETRFYVKNVMTNLWIYSKLMGKNAPTVASLAAGDGAVIDNINDINCQITNLSDLCSE
jgi:soluble lytic murein transglycosylase-like protein